MDHIAQIGEQLGIPKQTVLDQLRRDGHCLGSNKGRLSNPENYRLVYAPYGFLKKGGQLVPSGNRTRTRAKKIKNRENSISWNHATVGRVYKRWNGKL